MNDNIAQEQGQPQGQQQQQQPGQETISQQGQAPAQQQALRSSQQGSAGARAQGQEGSALQRGAQAAGAILIPPVDVIEDAGGITLLADLPGVAREGLHLRLEANSLTIEGELTLDLPEQMESRYAEVKHQYYQRTFALSSDLDAEQAVAELNHGVLHLRIPKARHAQPRKIEIQVS